MTAPMSVAIGELVDPVETWSPERDAPDESFNYIDLSAIDQEAKLIIGAREVSCAEAPSRARQIVAAGDVLVSTVRPNLNGVARVPSELSGATASTGFCLLRPQKEKLDSAYLFHWVRSPQFIAEMVRRVTGANYPAVSERIVFESRMPLPPLPEQRRIAEVLDRAESLRAKRRAALAQLGHLTQSIFLDMFGDPLANTKDWPIHRLEELCLGISDIDHKMPVGVEGGVPFISAKDLMDDGGISFERAKRISEEDFQRLSRKSKPEKGNIIYSRIGVNLGKARMVEVDFPFLASYSCCTIKANRELVDANYLCRLLDSPFTLRQAHKGIRAIAVPDLGLGEIKAFKVILPPLHLQREFAKRVEAVEKLKAVQCASLAELDALFVSLQHRAFPGELSLSIPNM